MVRKSGKKRAAVLTAAVVAVIAFLVVLAPVWARGWESLFGTHQVGEEVNGKLLLPSNQWIKPVGSRILVDDGRLTASTLSPDGTKLAALSWSNFTGFLTIMAWATGRSAPTARTTHQTARPSGSRSRPTWSASP